MEGGRNEGKDGEKNVNMEEHRKGGRSGGLDRTEKGRVDGTGQDRYLHILDYYIHNPMESLHHLPSPTQPSPFPTAFLLRGRSRYPRPNTSTRNSNAPTLPSLELGCFISSIPTA